MVRDKGYCLSLYEKAMPHEMSMLDKCLCVRQYGYDYLELSIDETDEKLNRLYDCGLQQEIRDAMQKSQVPIRALTLSGHRRFPLGSRDDAVVKQSLDIFYRTVDLAVYLGASIIQMAGYDVYYEPGDAKTQKQFEKNLEICVNYASSRGILCALETMETSFMDTIKKARVWCDRIQSPYLKIYPDLGNITNAAHLYHSDVEEDIELGRGLLVAAHLKDAKAGIYRDLQFGEGIVDFESGIRALWNQGVRLFGCEFWYQDGDVLEDTLHHNRQYVRKILDALSGGSDEG